MSTTPITEAIEKLRAAVYTALSPLAAPRGVYWLQAQQGAALPFVVYHDGTAGGVAVKHLQDYAWRGLVIIKALANSQSAAETLLDVVLPGMNSLTSSGYTFFVEYARPIILPPDVDGVWSSCAAYDVEIHKP